MLNLDFKNIIVDIETALKNEWVAQGHDMGGFVDDLETEITYGTNSIQIIGTTRKNYVKYVDAGVKPSKIPYTPGKSRAKTSKYIEGLIKYFERKGADDPKSAAFATARKQKKEGMSTVLSRIFSRTGKRQNFIEEAFSKINNKLTKAIENLGSEAIRNEINNKIKFR